MRRLRGSACKTSLAPLLELRSAQFVRALRIRAPLRSARRCGAARGARLRDGRTCRPQTTSEKTCSRGQTIVEHLPENLLRPLRETSPQTAAEDRLLLPRLAQPQGCGRSRLSTRGQPRRASRASVLRAATANHADVPRNWVQQRHRPGDRAAACGEGRDGVRHVPEAGELVDRRGSDQFDRGRKNHRRRRRGDGRMQGGSGQGAGGRDARRSRARAEESTETRTEAGRGGAARGPGRRDAGPRAKSDPFSRPQVVVHNAGGVNNDRSVKGMETLAEQKLDVVTSAKMLETFQLNALGPLRVQQAVDKMMASPGKVCVVSTRGRAEVSSRPLPSPRNIHVAAAASPRPASAISTERRIDLAGTGMGSIGDNGSGGFYAYRASKAAVNMIARGGVSFSKGSRRRTVGGRVAATPRARACPWVAVSPRGRSTRHPRRRRDPSRMIHVHSRRRRASPRTIHAAPAAAPRSLVDDPRPLPAAPRVPADDPRSARGGAASRRKIIPGERPELRPQGPRHRRGRGQSQHGRHGIRSGQQDVEGLGRHERGAVGARPRGVSFDRRSPRAPEDTSQCHGVAASKRHVPRRPRDSRRHVPRRRGLPKPRRLDSAEYPRGTPRRGRDPRSTTASPRWGLLKPRRGVAASRAWHRAGEGPDYGLRRPHVGDHRHTATQSAEIAGSSEAEHAAS